MVLILVLVMVKFIDNIDNVVIFSERVVIFLDFIVEN